MLAEAKKRQMAAKNSTDETVTYVKVEKPGRKIFSAKPKRVVELEEAK